MSNRQQLQLENNGNNHGTMVGVNNGTINNVTLTNIARLPSIISSIIKSIIDKLPENLQDSNILSMAPFTIEGKLDFNNVIKYREIINDSSVYYDMCNRILDVYDDSNLGGKEKILKTVHQLYLEEKGDILRKHCDSKSPQEVIRSNSDVLIDAVKVKISEMIRNDLGTTGVYEEELLLGLTCFICYCFMECKILERPV